MITKTKSVNENAVIARINRKLIKEGQQLRRARGFTDGCRWHEDTTLGRYYILDLLTNTIVATHCGVDDLAADCGII